MNRHNKRPRASNDETANRTNSPRHQEVLDCLLAKLLSLQDDETEGSSQTQQFAKLQQDQQLVHSLQESLQSIQQRLEQKKARLYQHYSLLRRLDEGVRNQILEYLDEEGFWVLEESTVMAIDSDQAQEKWRQLYRKRDRPFPELTTIADYRDYGIRFAKASRMARCLQELARHHYHSSGSASTTKKSLLQHSWPTHSCGTLRMETAENLFFVRLVYNPPQNNDDGDNNNNRQPPPIIIEGFADETVYDIDERPSHSEIVLSLDNVGAELHEGIYESINQLALEEFDSADGFHEAELQAKRRIGDRLSITVLEAPNFPFQPGFEMRLVVSTSGFSYEDGEYLYLKGRSPDFTQNDPNYRGNDCIRVGLELETSDNRSLGISLTG